MKPITVYRYTTFLLFINLILPGYAKAQSVNATANPKVKMYLTQLIGFVKDNSAFSDKLNWPAITKEIEQRADTMTAMTHAPQLTAYLIKQLKAVGDQHSFLMNKAVSQGYSQGSLAAIKPTAKLLPESVGYINVPMFNTTNTDTAKQFATQLQSMIKLLDTEHNIRGWIVDLRENYGGSMYPMIAGLGPLLGNGTLGYFSGKANNKPYMVPWYYKNGATGINKGVFVKVNNPYHLKSKQTRIAVLINKGTNSSGEMTAVSFWGAKNVKFFGEPSGGLLTGNTPCVLLDGSTLLVATSYTANRSKILFMDKIIPDVIVEQSNNTAKILEAATKWLLGER